MSARSRVDKPLLILVAMLVLGGCLIFASAAFGLLARGATNITSVVFNHLALGLGGGLVALYCGIHIDARLWRRYAPYVFCAALVATAAVFIPHLGFEHGGGKRWIAIHGFTLQPSEGLKIASVLMAAAYCAGMRERMRDTRWGLGGLLAILIGPGILLLFQPDIGTLGVITIAVGSVFFAAGIPWRDIGILCVIALLAIGGLSLYKPYIVDRITIFLHPSTAPRAEGYQIRQSLIAIGSGGMFGRGFGQGVQKFTYLPEPMGDSIFAVAAEELGFMGGVIIILAFLFFALRGFSVGAGTADVFSGLVAVGISSYLVCEAFVNIGAMLGVVPLTGIPLTFVSQGGTAMLASLASTGILLGVSRGRR